MNLKSNYLLKKLLKWGNKKCKDFNIYNVVLLKKVQKNTWGYNYFTPVYQKSWWYDIQFSRYTDWNWQLWVWLTEIGNYVLFFALYPPAP